MIKLLLSCEHGGNSIPVAYTSLFSSEAAKEALASHRGWDWGALDLFKSLKPLSDAHQVSTTTRLLMDLNRSIHNPQITSEFSKPLPMVSKEELFTHYYLPYRMAIETQIAEWMEEGMNVWHLSVHSFTPIWDGEERNADVGLLYDPSRIAEKAVCLTWKALLRERKLNVRCNYPYLGIADGLPTYLRKRFPKNYIGIELEVNQKFASPDIMDASIKQAIISSLEELLTYTGELTSAA